MNKRIRINGVLYEAVDSRNFYEDTAPYKITKPSVSNDWTVGTSYNSRDVELISTLKFTYHDVAPLYIEFKVTTWKRIDNIDDDPSSSFWYDLYKNPGISCIVRLGNKGSYHSYDRVLTNDEDGTKTIDFISDIIKIADREFSNFYDLACDPNNTLVNNSKILEKAANSAINSISRVFERGTKKNRDE